MYAVAMLFQLGISALSVYVLARALRWRSVPKMRYFFLVAQSACLYAVAYLLEMDTHSLWGAYSAQCMRYMGVACYAVFFYLFVRDFGNRPLQARWALPAMLVLPGAVLLCILLWPSCTLYFRNLSMFTGTDYPYLLIEWGPLFYVQTAYCYGLIALSAWEVLRHYPRATRADRYRRLAFLLAAILPNTLIFLVGDPAPGAPMHYQPGSALLVVSLFFLGRYIQRYLAVDWLPFARDTVVEKLNDGYVLVDKAGGFIEANRVALDYFPFMGQLSVGDDIAMVPGFPAGLARGLKSSEDLCLPNGKHPVYLRASATPILHKGKLISTCVMLYNVTENHLLMEKLRRMATSDSLTGLSNRAAFFGAARRDFELARRAGQDVTLLMLDVDFFKRVNDTYGHPKGDEVLRRLGGQLKSRLRRTDICGRFGGEEFCVLLPATTGPGALHIAEDLRAAVEALRFSSRKGVFGITISIGVAQRTERHETLDMLLADADDALYQAKAEGRNRVCPHESMAAAVP